MRTETRASFTTAIPSLSLSPLQVFVPSPLVVADGSDDAKHQGPAGPQAVPLTLQDLQDTLKLLLPDVGVEHVGELLQGIQQEQLQPLWEEQRNRGQANDNHVHVCAHTHEHIHTYSTSMH